MIRSLFHNFWLCLLVTLPSLAQVSEKRAATGRTANIVYTSWPEDVENPVTILLGKELQTITLSKRMTSEAIKIPADGIVRLVKKIDPPPPADQSPYQILAQATIPEGVNKVLIILVPVKNLADGMIFQCRLQDLASFKGGDYLFLNLTTTSIGVQMAESKILIKPGQSNIYSAAQSSKPSNVSVNYNFYDAEKEKWKLLSASTVVSQSTRREICIFSWDTRFERMEYHGITFPVDDGAENQ